MCIHIYIHMYKYVCICCASEVLRQAGQVLFLLEASKKSPFVTAAVGTLREHLATAMQQEQALRHIHTFRNTQEPDIFECYERQRNVTILLCFERGMFEEKRANT